MQPELPDIERPQRPTALAGAALTGIIVGPFVGATTNAINGLVSPTYFINILRLDHGENPCRAAIAQGIFEGLAFGFFYALVFTVAAGYFTGVACTYRFAVKHLLGIVAGTCVCWVLGGLAGMALAAFDPGFFSRHFHGVPQEPDELRAFVWVGGSIWGVQLGGLLSLILGIIYLRAGWQREISG